MTYPNELPDSGYVYNILHEWAEKGYRPNGVICHSEAVDLLKEIFVQKFGDAPLSIRIREYDYDGAPGTDIGAFQFYTTKPWGDK